MIAILAGAAAAGTVAPAGGGIPGPARIVRTGYAMGTSFRVEVAHPSGREAALAASEAAIAAVESVESLLSTWRVDSPLSLLNASPPGVPAPVPAELLPVLTAAFSWVPRTGGAFDPRVGALVDAWDLRGEGRVPDAAALAGALAATGEGGISLSAGRFTRRHSSAWLDAGAFGKGAALSAAAAALRTHGVSGALVDLGGQLVGVGRASEADGGWTVSVAHPRDRGRPAGALVIRDASVATSGTSERGVEVDGERFGHLLDPRTGTPAPHWGSVTVVSADPLEADVLSTALYVMGPEAGMDYARGLSHTGVLFLVLAGDEVEVRRNPAMERWLLAPFSTAEVEPRQTQPTGIDP